MKRRTSAKDYRNIYVKELLLRRSRTIRLTLIVFDDASASGERVKSQGSRAALFIMLSRGYPIFATSFQLLNSLLEIDEQLSTWR